jgi:hypothetical protein
MAYAMLDTTFFDRSKRKSGAPAGEPSRERLVAMVLGTYREMPGLCLHLPQAARLFGVSAATCKGVLDQLVKTGDLHRMEDGQYRT